MAISIKNEREAKIMRKAGKILASIINEIVGKVQIGLSTLELDKFAHDLCKKNKVKPAFMGYLGYPSVLCVGVNDIVVHGIPSSDVLKEGDILSVDMGVIYKGYYSDSAVTVGVGKISKGAEKLINATRDSLYAAIRRAKEGNTIGDLGYAIQSVAELAGFSVVRRMVGHGVGKNLHEEPQIPGYGTPGEGERLESGMTLAIEAIINEGDAGIRFLDDGWTTKTMDGKLSAIFEHTVLVRKDKAEILTER
jgi:methionyl aminopeptidase